MCVNSCCCAWKASLRHNSFSLHREKLFGKICGKELKVATMHERLLKMMKFGDAFIALPSGFGTVEEIFQIVSWA
ncbi:hypothetical protein DITRI_Ditri08aG0057100 [Diplodiscus trichospermus]